MKFPPVFTETPVVKRLLYELDVLKSAYALRPLPEAKITIFRQQSLLKSALFSARIEGNPLTLAEASGISPNQSPDTHTREVTNLAKAYETLPLWQKVDLSLALLKAMHAMALDGVSGFAGHLRMEESAIFNQAGVAVYLTPAPQALAALLDELVDWVNTADVPAPVVAAVAHIWFEKIHPFDDGNGRVGRLLSARILAKGDYGFGGIVPLEEYLEKNRQSYYDALGKDIQDVTGFVEFYLTALVTQTKQSLASAERQPLVRFSNLLPRRAEIVEVIRDHKMVSFDFISRRFRRVPTRTLHYDLAQLIRAGYVKRLGATRGAQYIIGDRNF